MKHIRWQILIALVGVAFLSAVMVVLALGSTTVERADFGGTFIEGIAGRPSAINPLFSQYNEVDRDVASLVFSGLTRADESGTIRPDLATHWTVSPDGLVYTFTLRTDVRWHDGVRFSPEDVVYTIHSIQDSGFKGPPNLAAFWRTVAITQADEVNVRFQLTQPYAPFLNYTTIGILPAHLLREVSTADLFQHSFNRRPVGTGPFQIAELTGDSMSLDANRNFYGARPFLSRIQFKFYADFETLFAAFNRGEIEGISRILPAYLGKARDTSNLTLYNARLGGYSLVLLNLSKAPFQDRSVRQALLQGMNREKLINEMLQGQGLVANSPIEPGLWAWDPKTPGYGYDVDKARALLDAAGWKDKDGDGVREKDNLKLAFTLITNDEPIRVALANEIVRQWSEVGVSAVVQPAPASLMVQNVLRPRQFDAVLYEWRNLSNDPDQYENWHETQIPNTTQFGQNYSGLSDRDISEVLESARKTNDPARRTELYHRFQELFAERIPALLIYYPVYTYGVDTRVKGIQIPPMLTGSDRFRTVGQWYLKTRRVASNMAPGEVTAEPVVDRVSAAQPEATAIPPQKAPPSATPPPPASNQPPTAAATFAPPSVAPPSQGGAAQCTNENTKITSPLFDATVSGLTEIRGTAARANLAYWKLEYRAESASAFVQLYRSEQAVTDGGLSLWSTKTVPNGVYWLQLTVVDNTGNFGAPCQVRVNVAN